MIFVKSIKQGKISYYSLMLVIFLLPVYRELFVIALWPWFFFWLIEGIVNKRTGEINLSKSSIPAFLLMGYFFTAVLSLIWSQNISFGLEHLGRSVLLLIIPLVLMVYIPFKLDQHQINALFKAFVYGTIGSTIVLWSYAVYRAINFEGGENVIGGTAESYDTIFLYHYFSFLIHPTYYGMMLLMATSITMNEIKKVNIFSRSMFVPIALSLYFLVLVYLVSSRTMMIAAIGIAVWYLFKRIVNRKLLIILIPLICSLFIVLVSLNPRINYLIDRFRHMDSMDSMESFESMNERGQIWHSAYELIKEETLIGYGIGDTKDILSEKYKALGYFQDREHFLNCHNQFLESWIGFGIIGVLLLLASLIYPLVSLRMYNPFIYGGFLIIITTAFLFESVLNRLWGVAFLAVFYTLLCMPVKVVAQFDKSNDKGSNPL